MPAAKRHLFNLSKRNKLVSTYTQKHLKIKPSNFAEVSIPAAKRHLFNLSKRNKLVSTCTQKHLEIKLSNFDEVSTPAAKRHLLTCQNETNSLVPTHKNFSSFRSHYQTENRLNKQRSVFETFYT
jgi:phosphopantetheine adenylyltransferase